MKPARVKGVVLDENRRPVAGVEIIVTPPEGGRLRHKTDRRGRFEIEVQEGLSRYRFAKDGSVIEDELEAESGRVAVLTIRLASARHLQAVEAYNHGVAALKAGEIEAARDLFERSIAVDDTSSRSHLGLALARLEDEDHAGAVNAARRALKLDPEALEAWRVRLMASHALGDPAGIREAVGALLGTPLSANVAAEFYNRGLEESAGGAYEAAAPLLALAVELDMTQADAHAALAVVYSNLGDDETALAAVERALALEPDHRDALHVRSRVRDRTRHHAGITRTEDAGETRAEGAGEMRAEGAGKTRAEGATKAGHEPSEDARRGREARERTPAGPVIRLVPPLRRPVTGRRAVRVITTSPEVHEVAFTVDQREAGIDRRAPFAARIDFGRDPRPIRVRAVAYGDGGVRLGEDVIKLNHAAGGVPEVSITALEPVGDGRYQVSGKASVPPGSELRSVAVFLNETRVATVGQASFSTRFQTRARADTRTQADVNFVRVVATLEDGRTAEDQDLLEAPGALDEIDVNLVELYVVVTDRAGDPVSGLKAEDFTVRQEGEGQTLTHFGTAGEVPLSLGLVIDTSQSMWPLIEKTRRAAAQFLSSVLSGIDRGFVVDFDTRPRLAQALTADSGALLSSLGRLRPEGYTAIYDAILFSLLQFSEDRGRRALVVLTDGDDYRSRYTASRILRYARRHAAAVYIIALGQLTRYRGDPRDANKNLSSGRKSDLEDLAEKTGGRVYYIHKMEELDAAYRRIGAELRHQYLLAYPTSHPLGADEVATVKVQLTNQRLKARTVIGGRTLP